MIFFITFLRALAACIITNAHYTGVYPTDLIANGGLVGDTLFFAVSGYCLYNVRGSFFRWYGKRIYRVYPPVIVGTAAFMVSGLIYSMSDYGDVLWWYIYPTNYHFVASIIVLYIPFYFIMKIDVLKRNLVPIMVAIALVCAAIYFVWYDKSYYHIDVVREPMIRFLFMECMLLGAYFRKNDKKFRNDFKTIYPVITVLACAVYLASKLIFSKIAYAAPLQFINWITVYIVLFSILLTFSGLDSKLERMPGWIKKIIVFVAEITLEIYIVQPVLISILNSFAPFPLNWIILTASIIVGAYIVHIICKAFYRAVDRIQGNFRKDKPAEENV